MELNSTLVGGTNPSPTPALEGNDVSTTQYSNTESAEVKALRLLRDAGYSYLQQLDFVGKNPQGKYEAIELKVRDLFTPGANFPHFGTGLDRSQLFLRNQLLKDLGLRTMLVTFVRGTDDVYIEYIDTLEGKGNYYDTAKIRIYPLESFRKKI